MRSSKRSPCVKKSVFEPARIRTWNLLIRSQTRYPLRHRSCELAVGITLITLEDNPRHAGEGVGMTLAVLVP